MAQLRVGEQAPEVTFGKSDSQQISLAELRRDKPLVVAFLRHFG
jgi:peroxiredoxin